MKEACVTPKLTLKGRVPKNQFDLISLKTFFNLLSSKTKVRFAYDAQTGKKRKVLYHLKIVTVTLNAFKPVSFSIMEITVNDFSEVCKKLSISQRKTAHTTIDNFVIKYGDFEDSKKTTKKKKY